MSIILLPDNTHSDANNHPVPVLHKSNSTDNSKTSTINELVLEGHILGKIMVCLMVLVKHTMKNIMSSYHVMTKDKIYDSLDIAWKEMKRLGNSCEKNIRIHEKNRRTFNVLLGDGIFDKIVSSPKSYSKEAEEWISRSVMIIDIVVFRLINEFDERRKSVEVKVKKEVEQSNKLSVTLEERDETSWQ